jgi:hypothetical protein
MYITTYDSGNFVMIIIYKIADWVFLCILVRLVFVKFEWDKRKMILLSFVHCTHSKNLSWYHSFF